MADLIHLSAAELSAALVAGEVSSVEVTRAHLDQIAAWTKSNIDWVDGQLAFKGRIRRERWVEQAAELAKANVGA